MSTGINCHCVTDVNIKLDKFWAEIEVSDADGEKLDLTLFFGSNTQGKYGSFQSDEDRQEELYLTLLQFHDRLGDRLKELKHAKA